MATINGVLINPITKTCSIYPLDKTDYRDIQKAIGVECFDCARIDMSETIYVDDEGLMKPGQSFFRVDGKHPVVLAGKALILGTNNEGEAESTKLTLPEVMAMIDFVDMIPALSLMLGSKAMYSMHEPFRKLEDRPHV